MQTQTFNIALPKELVKKVDKQAKKEYRNRSELIRESLRIYLQDMENWEKIFAAGKKAGKKAGIKSEEDVNRIVYEYRHGRKSR
ncbi:ribbon-helix-helix protein, CopG family [Candidatus Daviesbacteria bacterium]|nr:ribbon-helix-helix protein, CopG family [Candidatus Daviesbacteria bacterium]